MVDASYKTKNKLESPTQWWENIVIKNYVSIKKNDTYINILYQQINSRSIVL